MNLTLSKIVPLGTTISLILNFSYSLIKNSCINTHSSYDSYRTLS